MSDLDIYVGCAPFFSRPNGYLLSQALPGLRAAGVQYRIFDFLAPLDTGRNAFLHVDLTELPDPFNRVHQFYARCVNGRAFTISRRLYSRVVLNRGDDYSGPVIVKSALNSRGLPEMQFAAYRRMLSLQDPQTRPAMLERLCPQYRIYDHTGAVPEENWLDPHSMVEKFIPGHTRLPVVKYRQEFFFELELNTRSTFDSLLCDPTQIVSVEFPTSAPPEVQAVRRQLNLDFGSVDYFIVDGEVFVIDVNKTTTVTPAWIEAHPPLQEYIRVVTERLVQFARGR